jgi:hypothetical protein
MAKAKALCSFGPSFSSERRMPDWRAGHFVPLRGK